MERLKTLRPGFVHVEHEEREDHEAAEPRLVQSKKSIFESADDEPNEAMMNAERKAKTTPSETDIAEMVRTEHNASSSSNFSFHLISVAEIPR